MCVLNPDCHPLDSLRMFVSATLAHPFLSAKARTDILALRTRRHGFTTIKCNAVLTGVLLLLLPLLLLLQTHETIAIAVNRIGGKSNSGEGGEDPIRWTTLDDADTGELCCAVCRGRGGVLILHMAGCFTRFFWLEY